MFFHILIKPFSSLAYKVRRLNYIMPIWNEQRSVQFIAFGIHLCLFFIIVRSVKL